MDYGTLRGFFALLILVLFIVIVIWSFSKKRKASFDEIANSILDDKQSPTNKSHLETESKQETNNNV